MVRAFFITIMNAIGICKKILVLALPLTVMGFYSCGDDDDAAEDGRTVVRMPDVEPVSDDIKPFVGYWTVSGGKKGPYEMMFCQDKVLIVKSNNYTYIWNFTPATSLLSTNYSDGFNVLQWNITLKTDNAWTGVGIDSNDGSVYSASRAFSEGCLDYLVQAGRYLVRADNRRDTFDTRSFDRNFIINYQQSHNYQRDLFVVYGVDYNDNYYRPSYVYTYYDKDGNTIVASDLTKAEKLLSLDVIRREEKVKVRKNSYNPEIDYSELPYQIKYDKDGDYVEFANVMEIHHPLSYSQVYYYYNMKRGYFKNTERVSTGWKGEYRWVYSDLVHIDSIVGTYVPLERTDR